MSELGQVQKEWLDGPYARWLVFPHDIFRDMVEWAKDGTGISLTLRGNPMNIYPLPSDVAVILDTPFLCSLTNKRRKAPRQTRKGSHYLAEVGGRLIVVTVESGIYEGGRRRGTYRYVRVVVPAPTADYSAPPGIAAAQA